MFLASAQQMRRSGRVTYASLLTATMWMSQSELHASYVGLLALIYWDVSHGVSASHHIGLPLTNKRW